MCTPNKVSTPSLLNNSPSESLQIAKTYSSDKSPIAKMENYIDQKFDKAALKHLKFQILEKIKNDIGKMNTNVKKKGIQSPRNNDDEIQSPRNNDDDLIRELRSLIITSNNQKNKS